MRLFNTLWAGVGEVTRLPANY